MQTPKARAGTLEMPQRSSTGTQRTPGQLKTPRSDLDSLSFSPNSASKTPKARSPKMTERKSPRSPVTEKKRPNRIPELESQLAQLQDDLQKAKEQLNSSESCRRRAQQEAEEAKQQFLAMSETLEESKQQLLEFSTSEDSRLQELRKISHERDSAWQSELEAIQKQHAMDFTALSSAINEIQKLKIQLEKVSESEASQTENALSADTESQDLKAKLAEALSLIDKLKSELEDSKDSESRTMEVVGKTQNQLEMANAAVENLHSENANAVKVYKSSVSELEQSQTRIKSLEGLVRKLQENLARSKNIADSAMSVTNDASLSQENGESDEAKHLKADLISLKYEVEHLRSALDLAEKKYQKEYIQSTLQIRSACEQVEHTKLESREREAKLQEELKKANLCIAELSGKLFHMEFQLQSVSKKNEELNLRIIENLPSQRESQFVMEHKELESSLTELKERVLERERELQNVIEENNALKMEIGRMEIENDRRNDEIVASAKAAKDAEREALVKLGHATEEADKINKKVARVTEQLDAAEASNSEMEAELRRLKVQADQWRKAAEAATAMLSSGNNGKFVERTGSLDSSYNTIAGKMGSLYLDDTDDESPKRKNTNMLKKLGVLWKKTH